MKRTRSMQSVLAAVVFACGMMGSMECSIDPSRPQHFLVAILRFQYLPLPPVRHADRSVAPPVPSSGTTWRGTRRQLRRHGLEARARPTPKSRPPGTASNPNSRCCSATLLAERIREIGAALAGNLSNRTVSGLLIRGTNAGIPSHASANGAAGLADGRPCDAYAVDSCSAWATCGGNLCHHVIGRSKRSRRHALCRRRNCQREGRDSDPSEHCCPPMVVGRFSARGGSARLIRPAHTKGEASRLT